MDEYIEEIGMPEGEFEQQYQPAAKHRAENLARISKAVSAYYDKKSKRIVLEMQSGVTLLVPTDLIQGLQNADEKSLSDFDLMSQGSQIHWHDLDVQFYVEDLLKGVFGTPKWMKSLNETTNKNGFQEKTKKNYWIVKKSSVILEVQLFSSNCFLLMNYGKAVCIF